MTPLGGLRPGSRYRIRHRAGSRTVTHTGLAIVVDGDRLLLRIPTTVRNKVHRLTGLGPQSRLGSRHLTIYSGEFVSAEEVAP